MLGEMLKQADQYLRASGSRLRNAGAAVEQQSQVIGRAFMTGNGFHHVGTIKSVLPEGEDALIYLKSFV